MHNRCPVRCNQQRFLFQSESLWEKLPEPIRLHCQELLMQMLRSVIHREEEERSEHERQD